MREKFEITANNTVFGLLKDGKLTEVRVGAFEIQEGYENGLAAPINIECNVVLTVRENNTKIDQWYSAKFQIPKGTKVSLLPREPGIDPNKRGVAKLIDSTSKADWPPAPTPKPPRYDVSNLYFALSMEEKLTT